MHERLTLVPLLVALTTSACLLTGIEPDEIDVADESGDEANSTDQATDGEAGGSEDGGTETGDPSTTGDGDGDPSTTGDGDGDPSTTGDGDGDPEDTSCLPYGPSDLIAGENPIEILAGASAFESSCGGAGPETVYRFVAPEAGSWSFAVTEANGFQAIVTLVSACDPLTELDCAIAPEAPGIEMTPGQVVYVIVDSVAGAGTGVLSVSKP